MAPEDVRSNPRQLLIDRLAELLPRSFKYPDLAVVRIVCGTYETQSDGFDSHRNKITANAKTPDGTNIHIAVGYTELKEDEDYGPFLFEEQTLIDTLSRLLKGYCEGRAVEDLKSDVSSWEHSSDRERFEQLFEQHEIVLDRMTDVFTALDADWRITYLNEGSRQAITSPLDEDLTKSDLIGRRLWDINPNTTEESLKDSKLYQSCQEAMERQEMVSHEAKHTEYSDWSTWVYTRVYPSETGVTIFSRDITERKEKELALERQVEQLQEYRRQIERLEEFTGIVSHDLRNPLNVAMGNLELAQETGDIDYLDDVEHGLNRMTTLIEDLLTLAREGKEIDSVDQVDIEELAHSCWDNVDTANASLDVRDSATILASESRLTQLFENLFRNAIEHGGTAVRVSVTMIDDGFAIEDNGTGIPDSERDRIFNVGYSTREEGTGFGLQIVKDIVSAHEWSISVTESANGGARFEITGVEEQTQ